MSILHEQAAASRILEGGDTSISQGTLEGQASACPPDVSETRVPGLLAWYDANKRDLPWRRTREAYAIWVSEVMLQQTQVQTVLPYFERWMKRFPTIEALAKADEQEALAIWQGLGYYRRCKMLRAGARVIAGSGIPQTAASLLKLPGVGRYTAAAIASIAFDEPAPLVDGNVERVFARLTGCELSGPALRKAAWDWARSALNLGRPGDHNQALMELGATVCQPIAPFCDLCPLTGACVALRHNQQHELPKPRARKAVVQLNQKVWIPCCDGRFGVRQIPPGKWWAGMWEFPRGERCPFESGAIANIGTVRHTVTHHRIRLSVMLCVLQGAVDLTWRSPKELAALPMPSPQRRALGMALRALASASTTRTSVAIAG